MQDIIQLYNELQKLKKNIGSSNVTEKISNITRLASSYLEAKHRVDLFSLVENKTYFSFSIGEKLSRPINNELFTTDQHLIDNFLNKLSKKEFYKIGSRDVTKAIYSIAMMFNCSLDISKHGDKKTPATFFEILIGHIFSNIFDKNPVKQLEVINKDMKSRLPITSV
ncbi:MAG: hypothetical protein AB1798_13950 [Spirochaetota bacterium]